MTHSCSNYVSRHEFDLRIQLVVATESLTQLETLNLGIESNVKLNVNIEMPWWNRLRAHMPIMSLKRI